MVGIQAYSTISLSSTVPAGQGIIHPGGFNTASALQDAANINAGLVRINFITPFLFPPVIAMQPVRVLIDWVSPGPNPFMPDGPSRHREVFPLPPELAVDGTADEIMDIRVARVHEDGALPVEGRPMPPSTKVEIEDRLLMHRIMNVERTFFRVQFASYISQIVRVRPYQLDTDTLGADDVQHGTVQELMFSYIAAGDLDLS